MTSLLSYSIELTPWYRNSEFGISMTKMVEFCNAAHLISRHSERVFCTLLYPTKFIRIFDYVKRIS